MSQVNRNVAGTLLGLSMVLASAGIADVSGGRAPFAGTARAARQPPRVARAVETLLSQLDIEDEPARRGYKRTKFPHWSDLDGDGCDTRDQVLIDESEEGSVDGCEVEGGEWFSIYDGKTVASPSDLDIDHVVALGEAWDSGASAWKTVRRERFANDLGYDDSLIAVTGSSNRSKSDKDPAEWIPPEKFSWCRFATAWVTVKVRWGLASDDAEIDGLRTMFATCRTAPPTKVPLAD